MTTEDGKPRVWLYVDDAGFVRAAPPLVYRRLRDVARWPDVSMAVRVRPDDRRPGPRTDAWFVETRGRRGRRTRYRARLDGSRQDQGFRIDLEGDLEGRAEYWLEPVAGGTVVHHLLQARTPLPDPVRVLQDHRRAVRRGLWGLKDVLHLEVRASAGLLP